LLLDGFDEVSGALAEQLSRGETRFARLLDAALKFRQVVLTTRPFHGNGLSLLNFRASDAYEIVGFSDASIQHYIECFFRHLQEPQAELGRQVTEYLKLHSSLWGLCRIPITLELVCSAYEKGNDGSAQRLLTDAGQITMTELYLSVTSALCRRYLKREVDMSNRRGDIDAMTDAELFAECAMPLRLLEHWAYSCFTQGKLAASMEVSIAFMRADSGWSATREASLGTDALFRQLMECGFIKPVGSKHVINERTEFFFPHRTFQEFFAARYLVRVIPSTPSGAIVPLVPFVIEHRFSIHSSLVCSGSSRACCTAASTMWTRLALRVTPCVCATSSAHWWLSHTTWCAPCSRPS
jgi:hypothetical protein